MKNIIEKLADETAIYLGDTNRQTYEERFKIVRNALLEQREEFKGVVNGMKKYPTNARYPLNNEAENYNQALFDILKAIEKL